MKGDNVMKKYIKPEIEMCTFDAQDIITESAAVPVSADGYAPKTEGQSFNQSTYIFNWNEAK